MQATTHTFHSPLAVTQPPLAAARIQTLTSLPVAAGRPSEHLHSCPCPARCATMPPYPVPPTCSSSCCTTATRSSSPCPCLIPAAAVTGPNVISLLTELLPPLPTTATRSPLPLPLLSAQPERPSSSGGGRSTWPPPRLLLWTAAPGARSRWGVPLPCARCAQDGDEGLDRMVLQCGGCGAALDERLAWLVCMPPPRDGAAVASAGFPAPHSDSHAQPARLHPEGVLLRRVGG